MKILKYGLPSGIQSSVYSISNILVQSSINSFGSAAIAGSSASTSITNFYNALNGLYQASIVFVSQNYGAKKFDRIKKIMIICAMYVLSLWAIQALLTLLFGKLLLGLFAPDDPDVIEMGWRKFNIIGYTYGLLGLMNIISGALRGMGASFLNMITSIAGVCGIRIIWILTVFKAIGTIESLYVCYPLSWTVTMLLHFCIFVFVYKKEKQKILS